MAVSFYMLELSDEEIINLWALMSLLDAGGKLDKPEQDILHKLERLVKGE
jgi:hypothetical protein